MRQKNHALTLRLNDEELKQLKDQVVASGLTTQTFLRLLIAGQKIKPRRSEVFIDLLHELSAIGNNINQIARVANTCGYYILRKDAKHHPLTYLYIEELKKMFGSL